MEKALVYISKCVKGDVSAFCFRKRVRIPNYRVVYRPVDNADMLPDIFVKVSTMPCGQLWQVEEYCNGEQSVNVTRDPTTNTTTRLCGYRPSEISFDCLGESEDVCLDMDMDMGSDVDDVALCVGPMRLIKGCVTSRLFTMGDRGLSLRENDDGLVTVIGDGNAVCTLAFVNEMVKHSMLRYSGYGFILRLDSMYSPMFV